jgi:hypothetical protein
MYDVRDASSITCANSHPLRLSCSFVAGAYSDDRLEAGRAFRARPGHPGHGSYRAGAPH